MELIRFDQGNTTPLDGGANVTFIPIHHGDRMTAMMLQLDRKGDTGKREVPSDVLLVVVSGAGSVRSGGTIAEVKAGDVLLLPGGLLHHVWTSDSTMQAILVTLPVG